MEDISSMVTALEGRTGVIRVLAEPNLVADDGAMPVRRRTSSPDGEDFPRAVRFVGTTGGRHRHDRGGTGKSSGVKVDFAADDRGRRSLINLIDRGTGSFRASISATGNRALRIFQYSAASHAPPATTSRSSWRNFARRW
jgi:hypothetical protein